MPRPKGRGLSQQESKLRAYFVGTAVVAMLLLACKPAGAHSVSTADAQGWSGPGWYITNAQSLTYALVLFEGPHALQSQCIETYDRFYSPIGRCRFVDAKPVEPAK
jgi:hypothetical protein